MKEEVKEEMDFSSKGGGLRAVGRGKGENLAEDKDEAAKAKEGLRELRNTDRNIILLLLILLFYPLPLQLPYT